MPFQITIPDEADGAYEARGLMHAYEAENAILVGLTGAMPSAVLTNCLAYGQMDHRRLSETQTLAIDLSRVRLAALQTFLLTHFPAWCQVS